MGETFGTATAAIGLAATLFQTAKGYYPSRQSLCPNPRKITMLTRRGYLQALSEDEVIADLLKANKAEVGVLIEIYNDHKEILDQHQLTEDLEQLLEYVPATAPASGRHLIASIQEGGQLTQISHQG